MGDFYFLQTEKTELLQDDNFGLWRMYGHSCAHSSTISERVANFGQFLLSNGDQQAFLYTNLNQTKHENRKVMVFSIKHFQNQGFEISQNHFAQSQSPTQYQTYLLYLSWQHCHSLFVTTLCILIGASYLHNGLDRHKNDLMTPICIEMDPRNDISLLEREWV